MQQLKKMIKIMKSKQSQKSGNDSKNYQVAGDLNINGLGYSDVKQIAIDVFQNNFEKLSKVAYKTALDRAEKITIKFLDMLKKEYPEGIRQAEYPAFQRTLFNVQKEYAITGNENNGDLLVNLLIDRTKQGERTLEQIVLDEAITTIPKLTKEQIGTLSVIFLTKRVIYDDDNCNTEKLINILIQYYQPFISDLSKNINCYLHLEYASCGKISIAGESIIESFKKHYGGVFNKGFDKEQLNTIKISEEVKNKIITICLNDKNKLRINAMNTNKAIELINKNKINDDTKAKLLNLNASNLMNNNEIKQLFIDKHKHMERLFDVYDNSYLKRFNLTSVGVAIGHANIKGKFGTFNDLNVWIN